MGRDKVLHTELLLIDLIGDLSARKGEKEWSIGLGIFDNIDFDRYDALVEYEFSPINRLRLKVELQFSFYYANLQTGSTLTNRLNSLKLAAQYSFYVS
jgi:hypothetical protein